MDEFAIELGRRVAKLRVSSNLTLAELASISGISKTHLYNIEHGSHSVSIAKLKKIADALDVSLNELLPSSDKIAQKSDGKIQDIIKFLYSSSPEFVDALSIVISDRQNIA